MLFINLACHPPSPSRPQLLHNNVCGNAGLHARRGGVRDNVAVRVQREEVVQHGRRALLREQHRRLLVLAARELRRAHLLLDAHQLLVQHAREQLPRHAHACIAHSQVSKALEPLLECLARN
jgi:hypothetical protein